MDWLVRPWLRGYDKIGGAQCNVKEAFVRCFGAVQCKCVYVRPVLWVYAYTANEKKVVWVVIKSN